MKRLRPVNSCLPCRKRRVRCDKVHPTCSRCRVARIECSYYQDGEAQLSDSNIPASATAKDLVTTVPGTERTEQSSQQHGESDITYVSTPERHPSSSQADLPHPGRTERGQFYPELGGRSSYLGSTFWANPIQTEFNTFNDNNASVPSQGFGFLHKWAPPQGQTVDWTNQVARWPSQNEARRSRIYGSQCKFCGDRYKLSCMVAMLPDQKICQQLCNLFFATVFPIIPLLHLPAFTEDFHSFWREVKLSDGHNSQIGMFLRKKPGFFCLLSSIMFASLVSVPPMRLRSVLGDDNINITPGDMHFATVMSAALTGFPRSPSIYSLAAYILVQSQFMREEDFSHSADFISTAFRLALGMGLHRHLPQASFSISELEMRRRLWWYILHLDVMSSASSGLSPFFIDEKMANTEMISPYYQNEGDGSQIDVRYLVASRRYEMTKEIRNILRLHFEDAFQSVEQVNEVVGTLKTFSSHISETITQLLSTATSATFPHRDSVSIHNESIAQARDVSSDSFARIWKLDLGGHDADVSIFCSWSTILLHLMVHKAYCILYHPLIRDPALASNPSIRSNAVLHVQSFLYLFYRLCSDPISDPFHWMYPGTYQPLQPLSLILADLLQYPYSDEAVESRGLVDLIFNLYQVDEGIIGPNNPPRRQLSSTGKDAWSVLSRTRRKAWAIVGCDSHALFPSERVSLDFCICGERIARNCPHGDDPVVSVAGDTVEGPYGTGLFLEEDNQNFPELTSRTSGTTPVPGATIGISFTEPVGVGDFDWQEWDSMMNTGIML